MSVFQLTGWALTPAYSLFSAFHLAALLFSMLDNLNAEINCGSVDLGLLRTALELPVFMSIDAINTW